MKNKIPYIKVLEVSTDIKGCLVLGSVRNGTIKEGALVKVLTNSFDDIGLVSHIESINQFGIDLDSITIGQKANFLIYGLSPSVIQPGMMIEVCEIINGWQ